MANNNALYQLLMVISNIFPFIVGGVKTERVFPGLSVLRKNNKMEVLSPEKWKYYPRKNKNKKGKIRPALERSPAISADVFSGNSTSKMRLTFFSGNSTSKMRLTRGDVFPGTVLPFYLSA
jgi:hypothetical protein